MRPILSATSFAPCSQIRLSGRAVGAPNGAPRGGDSGHLPPTSFVSFLQDHQIGNRPGEQLDVLAPAAAIEAAFAVLLLAPMPPLLFMGEDWGETRPFPFFCDFRGRLADAVRAGRRKEFRQTNENKLDADRWIDPLAERTFRATVLIGVLSTNRHSLTATRWCAGY